MNRDERFQQRWEFRRKEDEEDSSSLDSSKSHEPSDKKLTLVLTENNAPECDKLDGENNVSKRTKAPKMKARKKNTVANDKPKMKRKRKRDNLDDSKGMITMVEDLKTFVSSLIHELSIAREEMSQQLREVAKEFAPDSGPNKKKGGHTQKKKATQPRKGNNKSNVKPQKRPRGVSKTSKKGDVAKKTVKGTAKQDRAVSSTKTNELRIVKANDASKFAQTEEEKGESAMPSLRAPVVLSTDSNLVASTPFLTNSQVQRTPRNGMKIGKVMDAKAGLLGFKADEQFGNFSCFGNPSHPAPALLIQSCSQTGSARAGFPVPLHKGLGICSNMSENLIGGPRRNCSNSNFGGGNQVLSRNGEFVALTSQDSRVVFMAALRNQE